MVNCESFEMIGKIIFLVMTKLRPDQLLTFMVTIKLYPDYYLAVKVERLLEYLAKF